MPVTLPPPNTPRRKESPATCRETGGLTGLSPARALALGGGSDEPCGTYGSRERFEARNARSARAVRNRDR